MLPVNLLTFVKCSKEIKYETGMSNNFHPDETYLTTSYIKYS